MFWSTETWREYTQWKKNKRCTSIAGQINFKRESSQSKNTKSEFPLIRWGMPTTQSWTVSCRVEYQTWFLLIKKTTQLSCLKRSALVLRWILKFFPVTGHISQQWKSNNVCHYLRKCHRLKVSNRKFLVIAEWRFWKTKRQQKKLISR